MGIWDSFRKDGIGNCDSFKKMGIWDPSLPTPGNKTRAKEKCGPL